jgi:hypothetical protein
MKNTLTNLCLKEVDLPTFEGQWDDFQPNLFVNPLWVNAMSTNCCSPVYIHFVQGDVVYGKIAGLVIKGNWLQGRQLYFYSSPTLKIPDNDVFQECLTLLKKFAVDKGYTRFSIRPWDQEPAFEPKCKKLLPTCTNEYVIDVQMPNYECSISGRITKNIKKANKAGAVLRQSTNVADLDLLLSFLDSTRSRRISKFGKVYSPYYIFNLNRDTIIELMKNGMAYLFCADLDGQTCSVLLMVESGNRVCCLLKGSHPEGYKNGLSSFVDLAAVKHLRNNGVRWLNLGPELVTDEGKGLNQYKEGICAVPTKRFGLYTFYLVFPYRLLNPLMLTGSTLAKYKFMANIAKNMSGLLSGAQK